MSTPTNSTDDRLARLLDSPLLARVVPHLAPETLHQLIAVKGLEACGELVAAATPAQLTSLLDLDLWRPPQPGRDDQFDADRFGEWLEMLIDSGESIAARTIASLDRDLVVAGLSRYVRVFDPGIFEPTAQSDDELSNRHEAMHEGDALEGGARGVYGIECEVGGYMVRARRDDAWDAIVALLVALAIEQPDAFDSLMRGCRAVSNSRPEADGFHDLLMAPQQQLHDLSIERERRRSRRGYATNADARAFLQLARQSRHTPITSPSPALNPIAIAYFRDAIGEHAAAEDDDPTSFASTTTHATARASARDDRELVESLDAVVELLTEAGLMPGRPRALLEGGGGHGSKLSHLRHLMALAEQDDHAYHARSSELAFLANTLLSGCSIQSRPFTPAEASDAAACICNLGLEYASGSNTFNDSLIPLFELGWSVLHQDVSMFAAGELMAVIADLRCTDIDTARDLRVLRSKLEDQRASGTPWLARDAANVLATLDPAAWLGVLGLLDECPNVPAALTAVVEQRTEPISQAAFEFISTRRQLESIRTFLQVLPRVLRN